MTASPRNTLRQLIDYFGCEGRPCTPAEFKYFWESCTDEQKEYYKNAEI